MTNFIKLFFIGILGLIASCATSNKEGDGEKPTIIVGPIIIKPDEKDKFQEKLESVRRSTHYHTLIKEGDGQFNPKYYKGLDKMITYGLLNQDKSKQRSIAFIGHRVQKSLFAQASNSVFQCINGSCSNNFSDTSTYYGGSSNATFAFFATPFDAETQTNSATPIYTGVSSILPPVSVYIAESQVKENFDIANVTTAIQYANQNGNRTIVYDFMDGLRRSETYKWTSSSGTNLSSTSAQATITNNNIASIASNLNAFLSKSDRVVVMPTGTLTKYSTNSNYSNTFVTEYETPNMHLSYGVFDKTGNNSFVSTDGLLTGNMVQMLQLNHNINANQNSIALSIPVFSNGSTDSKGDYVYSPDKKSVLPGTLRDYAFSVAIKKDFGMVSNSLTTNNSQLTTGNSQFKISEGRFANVILASAINIIAQGVGDERKAIKLLKENYTIKKYATDVVESFQFNPVYQTGKFYQVSGNHLIGALNKQTTFQNKIIAYFNEYADKNSGKIKNQFTGAEINWSNLTNTEKVSALESIYQQRPEFLAQFITENDVMVCNGACNTNGSNALYMNGVEIKDQSKFKIIKKPYIFIDNNGKEQTGESTIYEYNGQVIASNIFGNGIISFDALDKTTVKNTKHNVFTTKASTSSMFGNAFSNSGLDKVAVSLGSVYEGDKKDDVMSINITNRSSLSQSLKANAIENFALSKTNTENASFNLGTVKFGFVASQKKEKNEILKNLTDFKALLEGEQDKTALTSDVSFVAPITSNFNIGLIAKGSNLNAITNTSLADGFSLISKNNGFRQTYSSFVDIFEAGSNLKATSFNFTGNNFNLNAVFGFNEKENIFTGKGEGIYLGMIEGEVKKNNSIAKFNFGVMEEKASIFGSSFAGGMKVEGTTTAFIGLEAKHKLASGMFGAFGFNYGLSFVNEEKDSLLQNFSNIHSSNLNASLGYEGVRGTLAFNYSTGLATHYGKAQAFNGQNYNQFSLKGNAIEQNFELSFANKATQYSSIKLALIHTENVGNIKGETQNIVALKTSKKF